MVLGLQCEGFADSAAHTVQVGILNICPDPVRHIQHNAYFADVCALSTDSTINVYRTVHTCLRYTVLCNAYGDKVLLS